MIIKEIETFPLAVPLIKPFKTALRTVVTAESIVVKISCDNGIIGWGEAPPTHVITGESLISIKGAIETIFEPFLVGKNLLHFEAVFQNLHDIVVGNSSVKAALDMALYDCLAKLSGLPLYQYLGGYQNEIETDFTVSVNNPEEMGEDAKRYVSDGFNILKVKVGKDDITSDLKRIQAIRNSVGEHIKLRLDANQGWSVKEAIYIIRKMEDLGLNIELIEQPVHKEDIRGLKTVTDSVATLIMADESVFSPQAAFELLRTRSADLINIKLMKSGGIYKALLINRMAELCGVECMVGSMIETRLAITAAAHFAASQKNITRFDFDAPLMLAQDRIQGGIIYEGRKITFPTQSGLGITGII
ncbi:mandelate racemase/muconate lactonizing enzyme family protein [Bacillus massiliigorillae]|uniref:mandelate racemase/muconate lactonizing enzyme family protein n=1 Tax=Bacillus massiliigorillae TaxID=1243664 RepID=UPI00039C77BD|nr:dipeptide epimerase [Bacillus massiliigorillae]